MPHCVSEADCRENVYIDQRLTRISDLKAVIKDLHHRACTRYREILMNQGIGNQLTHCQIRVHRHILAQGLSNYLIAR